MFYRSLEVYWVALCPMEWFCVCKTKVILLFSAPDFPVGRWLADEVAVTKSVRAVSLLLRGGATVTTKATCRRNGEHEATWGR